MDSLDGNAIAGLLYDVYGQEVTTATTICAHCGAARPAAELRVYLQAPGVVVRCPSCDGVVLALVTIHRVTCVDARGLDALEPEQ